MPSMIVVKESCGKCGEPLTGWIPNYYAIDVPFAQCAACGTLNDRSSKATEWRLMPSGRKVAIVALTMFWGLGYSACAWIVIGGVAMKLDPSMGDETIRFTGITLATFLLSLIVGIGGNALWLLLQIRKSNARLENPEYRGKLAGLNLLS